MSLIEKVFGTHSERELKRITPIVEMIDGIPPAMIYLSVVELL